MPDSNAEHATTSPAVARTDRYEPLSIEQKWFDRWAQDPDLYRAEPASSTRKKYYVLEMLPYPSGALHMGHVRNYSIGDALARYMWMQGHNVLHPMGWDAFGLPAENAAIKNQTPPKQWTLQNITAMKAQMKRLGFAYDWSKELTTCLPNYYRWNQWFFLKLYEKGLAYRKNAKVNWCPECATVLANEQVLANGCCWRHETTLVEQRELEQWFVRITKYADELLQSLDSMPGWPERVTSQQRHWIGRSEGTLVDFKLDGDAGATGDKITVFTTRVDTIFGATSLQLAPEHPLVADLVGSDEELRGKVDELIAEQRKAKEVGDVGAIDKHGVDTGRFAINPYNDEKVSIWVANYVLMDYGTGAIMSVPAHDERDYEFAKKYDLDIRVVIMPRREGDPENGGTHPELLPFTEKNSLLMNSGEYSGLACGEAIVKMSKLAEERGFGKATVTYKLRDWGFSRQRYWGTPIPMVYCAKDGVVPVPEKDLPVLLPENVTITQTHGSPLAQVPEFVNTTCPKCGGPARRETDTMDTFVDSSWYFYRYTDPSIATAPFDVDAVNYWFPIDQYIGGAEHAILHLIYTRFWTKFMRDIGLVKNSEPVERLFTQGMVIKGGAKMSKSLGNVVSPDDMVAKYGADSTRMYTLFAAPPDRDLDWQDAGVEGVSRFLSRVYRYVTRKASAKGASSKDNVILSEASAVSGVEEPAVSGVILSEATAGNGVEEPAVSSVILSEATAGNGVEEPAVSSVILSEATAGNGVEEPAVSSVILSKATAGNGVEEPAVSSVILSEVTAGNGVEGPLSSENSTAQSGSAALQRRENAPQISEPGFNPATLPPAARKIQRKLHQTLRRVTEDFGGRWHFNTSIAAIMELVNELYAHEETVQRGFEPHAPTALMADVQRNLVLMLAPFAPYLAAELWETIGETSNLLREAWPKYDPALAKEDEVEMAVQVNGKIRARITVPAEADDAHIKDVAMADEKVRAACAGKEIVKVLVVKGRLVNVVVK